MSENMTPAEATTSSGSGDIGNGGTRTGEAGSITTTGRCNVCQAPCKRRCAGCSSNVYYCSRKHQERDWKEHKTNCSPLVLAEDEIFGRYWVASRDIKAGETILKEKAAIVTPSPATDEEVVCVGCGLALTAHTKESCSKCGWPVCGVECEKATVHAKNECPVLASRAVPFPPPGITVNSAYLGLSILRILLKKTHDPELWSRINDLQSEPSRVDSGLEDFWTERYELTKDLAAARKALNVAPGLAANDQEWGRIFRIIRLNGFNLGCDAHSQFPHLGLLYLRGSLLSYSCVPNTNFTFSETAPDYCFRLKATADIKKREMVTSRYSLSDEIMFHGTDLRLYETRIQGGFWCKCPRCRDPTELGTYTSAIICSRCPNGKGIMLPHTFYDLNEPYRCQTPGCQHTVPRTKGHTTYDLIEHITREIREDPAITGVELQEAFIARTSGKILHPNHWLIIKASMDLLELYRNDKSGGACMLEIENLDRLLAHCRRVASFVNKIELGLTIRRIDILFMSAEVLRLNLELRLEEMNLTREQEAAEWAQVRDWGAVPYRYYKLDDEHRSASKKKWTTYIEILKSVDQKAKRKIEQLRGGKGVGAGAGGHGGQRA